MYWCSRSYCPHSDNVSVYRLLSGDDLSTVTDIFQTDTPIALSVLFCCSTRLSCPGKRRFRATSLSTILTYKRVLDTVHSESPRVHTVTVQLQTTDGLRYWCLDQEDALLQDV